MNSVRIYPICDGRPEILLCLLFAFLLLPVCQARSQDSAAIPNPVLPGVADAGVLRYNGEYYIGGVATNGGFYRSSDLVNWEGPFHVFSMDNDWTQGASADDSQIHASDMTYLNGVFHHYWSVNYWGDDRHVVHIGHATAPDVLGPYREPVRETWLAGRIDAHLFRDIDGKLYLYMVKFTDGNTIWARPMKDPATFSGPPVYLFASLPGTWETRDNRVAEGPWVIRYRDQYYMMYNANHTSTRWGNYALGVAQADDPLAFNNGNKYPHPVLQSNQEELEGRFPDLLSAGQFNYTLETPGKGWMATGFDDSNWKRGKAGFGRTKVEGATVRLVRTFWKSDHIWLRKTFSIDSIDQAAGSNLSLRMHHDGATAVYLNGTLIYKSQNRAYRHWNFDERAKALLKDGENTLAVESSASEGPAFLDVSLFDMKTAKAGDILFSPGQPNMVRGPNGFEWWLVYMANKNADRRGQYINRIHFFNKKLSVDGITSARSPGYHPVPASPTFGDLFNDEGEGSLTQRWTLLNGNWEQRGGELHAAGAAAAIEPRSRAAMHYRFEAGIRLDSAAGGSPGAAFSADAGGSAGAAGRAGIYAWRSDKNSWMRILLDRKGRRWTCELRKNGADTIFSHPLPEEFDYRAYHRLTVYKNGGDFRLYIDGLPAPGQSLIQIGHGSGELFAEGLPGLYAEGPAAFDGIAYTIGWDEFDTEITAWVPRGNKEAAVVRAPHWQVTAGGIGPPMRSAGGLAAGSPEEAVFKGDPMRSYEFSLQVSFTDPAGNPAEKAEGEVGAGSRPGGGGTRGAGSGPLSAGIYPVYADRDNYLKAVFDQASRELVISGKAGGEPLEIRRLSLATVHPVYADMKYSDFIEKHFTFDTPAWISTLRFSKTPHERPDTLIEDLYKKMDIFYRAGGRWIRLDQYREVSSSHPGFDKISFDPVKANAVKLVNKQAQDPHFYTYKLWVGELFKNSYNLRVSRLGDTVIFWVNGQELARVGGKFPPSRVGLTATGPAVRFNGITCFSLE